MDKGVIFEKLLRVAYSQKLHVALLPFKAYHGRLKDDSLTIASNLRIDEINSTFAHELAHFYLHYDKGDTIASAHYSEYEEQAERAAKMLLDVLEME